MKLVLVMMAVALLLTGCSRYSGQGIGGALPSGSDYYYNYYESPGNAD